MLKIDLDPVLVVCCLVFVVVSWKLLEHGCYVLAMLGFSLIFLFLILGSCEIEGERLV
jgi:hypothetical protein